LDPVSERLRARHPQRIDLSLDRMRALCAALGDPQHRLPPVVHVAGTNGKGSTVALIRAVAEAAGLKVHAYTSPHLVRFNERIRLAGRLIEDDHLNAVLDRIESVSGEATVFESTTAAAFLAMAETPADLAIIEVGLGGVLDATNVIERPLLSVITPVDYDHAEFLGTDLAGIASEKAGVLKAGAPGVIGRQREEAFKAIERRAVDVHARLTVLGVDFDAWAERGGMAFQTADLFMDLPAPALAGAHQIDNAAVAIAAALELDLPESAIVEGLKAVRWPARLQRISTGPYGQAAKAARAPRPLALICGMLGNKDAGGFFAALKDSQATVFTVGFDGAAAEPAALAAVARGHGLAATPAGSVGEALDLALRFGAGRVAICGSLYLAGEVLGASPETWPV
jgi:dihydrofolate synthase/folylpolyglutamate synthase